MLTLQRVGPDVIEQLAAALHPADAAELKAAGWTELQRCLAGASLTAMHWRGELLALLGCETHPNEPGSGIPWMLSTDAIERAPHAVVGRACLHLVQGWRQQHRRLANMVHRDNARALRLVAWLGFTINDDEPMGPGGAFWLFEWERPDV